MFNFNFFYKQYAVRAMENKGMKWYLDYNANNCIQYQQQNHRLLFDSTVSNVVRFFIFIKQKHFWYNNNNHSLLLRKTFKFIA